MSTSAPATTPSSSPVTLTVPPSSSPTTASPSTCTSVEIRLIRGGAAQQTEIGALQFVNTGHKPCALGGYPAVELLQKGTVIGSPSQPMAGTTAQTRRLAPGQTVQSLLRDFVGNCQAPLSDTVRVTVPGETVHAERPGVYRACTVRIGPLGKAY